MTSITQSGSRALACTLPSHGVLTPMPSGPYAIADFAAVGSAALRVLHKYERARRRLPRTAMSKYVVALWERYMAWQLRRTTRLLLTSLSDRILNDIGMCRSEIDLTLDSIDWRELCRSARV